MAGSPPGGVLGASSGSFGISGGWCDSKCWKLEGVKQCKRMICTFKEQMQGSHSLEKSLNFSVSHWKVLEFSLTLNVVSGAWKIWVYLGVKTCGVCLCFPAIIFLACIDFSVASLYSLFCVTREFHRFLHRVWGENIFYMLFGYPRRNTNHSSEKLKVICIKRSVFYAIINYQFRNWKM